MLSSINGVKFLCVPVWLIVVTERKNCKQIFISGLVASLLLFAAVGCTGNNETSAEKLVLESYANPEMVTALYLTGGELKSMENPNGEGVLVYADVGRPFVWLVLDNQVYALNGAAKDLTKFEPFLREASQDVIERSGLDPFNAEAVLKIVDLR